MHWEGIGKSELTATNINYNFDKSRPTEKLRLPGSCLYKYIYLMAKITILHLILVTMPGTSELYKRSALKSHGKLLNAHF